MKKLLGKNNKNSKWRMQSLTLEGKVIAFKTLDISKIVYFSMMIKVPTEIIVELENIQKMIYLAN